MAEYHQPIPYRSPLKEKIVNFLEALQRHEKVRRPHWSARVYMSITSGVLKMTTPLFAKPRNVTLLAGDIRADDWERYDPEAETHLETQQLLRPLPDDGEPTHDNHQVEHGDGSIESASAGPAEAGEEAERQLEGEG